MNPPAAKGCLDRNNDIKLAFMSMCSDDVDTVDDKETMHKVGNVQQIQCISSL